MKVFILISIILSVQQLYADNKIRGGGKNYCGYLINTVNQHEQYSGMWKQWITGLVSGYNIALNKNILVTLSDDSLYYAVKDRCQSKPKQKVYEALIWVIDNSKL
ncbi:hypothetical protein N9R86_00505 [Alphaproteobacteria bacterium]|nr:hypothetical protein [Alphaproteobacteria bacterium]